MAICDWGYEGGDLEEAPLHSVTLDLLRTNSRVVATLACYLLEIWCSDNCAAPWRIEQNRARLMIGFSSDLDMVHFKLSPEWDTIQMRQRTNY